MPDKLSELSHEALVKYLRIEFKYLRSLIKLDDADRIVEWAHEFHAEMTKDADSL